MPVRSPTLNAATDQTMSLTQDPKGFATVVPTTLVEGEETNENVSKEKLNNMRLMMKTFVDGALREKEQVNYDIPRFVFI